MTAADLKRLDELAKDTKDLRAELSRLRNASEVSAVNYSGTGGNGGTGDPVAEAACSAADVEEQILHNVVDMMEIIDEVPQLHVRKVMRKRYIMGYSWRRIAEELHYADKAAPYRLLLRYRNRVMSKHPENDNRQTTANGVK